MPPWRQFSSDEELLKIYILRNSPSGPRRIWIQRYGVKRSQTFVAAAFGIEELGAIGKLIFEGGVEADANLILGNWVVDVADRGIFGLDSRGGGGGVDWLGTSIGCCGAFVSGSDARSLLESVCAGAAWSPAVDKLACAAADLAD